MRKLVATVFNYSLDGLLANEGTEFWKFCFDLPENREPDDPAQLDFLQSAYCPIVGHSPSGASIRYPAAISGYLGDLQGLDPDPHHRQSGHRSMDCGRQMRTPSGRCRGRGNPGSSAS
jgi:hypothetical protein